MSTLLERFEQKVEYPHRAGQKWTKDAEEAMKLFIFQESGITRVTEEMGKRYRKVNDERLVLRKQLWALLDHYVELVRSGDCGHWNPDEEAVVKATREVLRVTL